MKLLKHIYFIILLALLCNEGSAQVNDTITATYPGTVSSGYTTDSCGVGCLYTLPVILPPGFTATDVTFSFAYRALGTCILKQGGEIVSLDSCKTSCYSCLINIPGACIETNASIFSEIRNCLPAAKCINDTLNFVLDFFRTTDTAGGCVFSCIEMVNNWSISVIGQIDTCTTAVIAQLAYASIFSVFPNPSTSQIVLHSSSMQANEIITVTITNAIGEIIQEEKRKWTDEMSFNIKSLTPGVYFVQMQDEKGRWVERFMKE